MREPLYDASRAVEDAAAIPGTRPVRLYRIALPLFAVEFDAVVEERRPYDLIDRFIVRSIAEAELRTVPEIAAFLGLEEAMVARALRFLGDVGHVVGRSDGTFALTELGARSVRGTARVVKHDRQKLYFDGVVGGPLPAEYYGRKIVVWDTEQATEQKRHRLMSHACPFPDDALQRLSERPDRRDFNVPDELRDITIRALDDAYLPCYVIRTLTPRGRSLLVYSAVSESHDEHLGRLCGGWPALTDVLEAGDFGDPRAELGDWLAERDIDPSLLQWTDAGTLRLGLPASRFNARPATPNPKGTFALVRLGSYMTFHSHVVQLWCDDAQLRRRAVLERTLNRVTASRRLDIAETEKFLIRLSIQLETSTVTVDELRHYAHHNGRTPLPF
ncbi:MAG TPA: hypothetical protein VIL71_00395 [Spirillospora sp.]